MKNQQDTENNDEQTESGDRQVEYILGVILHKYCNGKAHITHLDFLEYQKAGKVHLCISPNGTGILDIQNLSEQEAINVDKIMAGEEIESESLIQVPNDVKLN